MSIVDDIALAAARELLIVRLNKGVNLLAGRDDLIASVKWDASPHEPPAWYTHATNEATLNGPMALAGAHPAEINPLTPSGRRRHPVLVGLLCHEGSHAHSTQWTGGLGERLPAPVVKAAVLLEEPRIEKRQLQRRPHDRIYLRAASRLIILPDATTASATATRWRAAQAAVLTAGRVDAGVLDVADVRTVVAHCRKALGRTDFTKLRRLWRTALDLDDGDVAGLVAVATRWVELVGVDAADQLPDPPCARGIPGGPPAGGDPEPGKPGPTDTSSGASGEPDSPAPGEDASDALGVVFRAAMRKVGQRGIDEAAAELRDHDDPDPVAGTDLARRAEEAADREACAAQASRVFHGDDTETGSPSPLGPSRQPTPAERILARQTGQALRRARFRERSKTITPAAAPPGRLVGRNAVLAAAQRSRSIPVTAKPFRRTVRRHTPQPPLRVGIAVDVSGSMGWATEIMASTAWVVAHAVAQVGGKSATVCFGDQVTAVTKPGLVPARVTSFLAEDGSEMFTDAVRALDGGLGLTTSTGARLVFVVSDGHFVAPGEPSRARRTVERLNRHGVLVLWLDLQRRPGRSDTIIPPGAVAVPITNVEEIPHQVGSILVTSLRAQ